MEEELIAPCGMNCAVCGNYLAMKFDIRRFGAGKQYCAGCRPRGENCIFMAQHCERIGQGKVDYCFNCGDFPCKRLKALDKRYRTRYNMSMMENLLYLRENGLAAFLEKEQEKWKCPECGGTLCCHGGSCYACRIQLLNEKGSKSWYRK